MTAAIAWLRRLSLARHAGRERAEQEALARRLRRDLPRFEARLALAAEALEGATYEEIHAETACRETAEPQPLLEALSRLELARETRRLAGIGFDVARRQVNLRVALLTQLEREFAEDEETTAISAATDPGASTNLQGAGG